MKIGPPGSVSLSLGILMSLVFRRIDVVDNEVRRSLAPPVKGDKSPWMALGILGAADVSVRGSLLSLLGASPLFSRTQREPVSSARINASLTTRRRRRRRRLSGFKASP